MNSSKESLYETYISVVRSEYLSLSAAVSPNGVIPLHGELIPFREVHKCTSAQADNKEEEHLIHRLALVLSVPVLLPT